MVFTTNVNLIHGQPIEPDGDQMIAVRNELNSIRKNHGRFVKFDDT